MLLLVCVQRLPFPFYPHVLCLRKMVELGWRLHLHFENLRE